MKRKKKNNNKKMTERKIEAIVLAFIIVSICTIVTLTTKGSNENAKYEIDNKISSDTSNDYIGYFDEDIADVDEKGENDKNLNEDDYKNFDKKYGEELMKQNNKKIIKDSNGKSYIVEFVDVENNTKDKNESKKVNSKKSNKKTNKKNSSNKDEWLPPIID